MSRNYNDDNRRVPSSGGVAPIIVAVLAIAVSLILVLLVFLPATETEVETDTSVTHSVVSLEYPDGEIGLNADLSKIFVTVTYDDGTKEEVSLSRIVNEGLNTAIEGTQKISLSYGGFEQTLEIDVVDVDCEINYLASAGGRIQGESKQLVVSGSDADTVIAVPETGYVFKEWSDGYPFAKRLDRGVNRDMTLMANFQKAVYRVVFFYNDGTVARECDVMYGDAVTGVPKMTDPRMSVYGYTFEGWSVNEEDYQTVIRDMYIYPQYRKTAVDVTMDVSVDQDGTHMGSTDVNECGYYAYDETGVIVATPYNSREFDSWQVWGFAEKSSVAAQWITIPKQAETGASIVTVYIGDNRTSCKFTSNASGNAGTEYSLTFTPDSSMDAIELKAVFAYSKSKITFMNLQNSIANNEECSISDFPFTTTLRDVYLNSKATQPTAEYKINTQDGHEVKFNDETALIQPEDSVGMKFVGWYNKKDSTQTLIDADTVFYEPTTLMAKWEKLVYTVVFDYTSSEQSDYTYSISVIFSNSLGSGGGVPAVVPLRDKYRFLGWEDKLTHELVDDKTQINSDEAYLNDADKNFTEKCTVYMVPRWEAVSHMLTVGLKGAGKVTMEIISDIGYKQTVEVPGVYTIYETYTYTVYCAPDNGNLVKSYILTYNGETQTFDNTAKEEIPVSPVLNPRFDNVLSVEFSPLTFTVTVKNGDGGLFGSITDTSDGSVSVDGTVEYTEIPYNTTLGLKVETTDASYEISGIYLTGVLDGKAYADTLYTQDLKGTETHLYHLILEKCTSKLTVRVEYGAIGYQVSVVQPKGATVSLTKFNGTESDKTVAPEETTYVPEEKVCYVVEAGEGKYISTVRVNGVDCDVFSPLAGYVFYGWEINGEDAGIDLKLIGGVYYYAYGTADYEGETYLYCETVSGGEPTVFLVLDAENEQYDIVEEASNAAMASDRRTSLFEVLQEALYIDSRSIHNGTAVKDRRVTKVYLMLTVTTHLTVNVTTDEIVYQATIANTEYGEEKISAKSVKRGGEITVKAKPSDGYTVVGYRLNGTEYEATASTQGGTFSRKFTNITADFDFEVLYEILSYTVTFSASKNGVLSVKEESESEIVLLNNSHSYSAEYGAKLLCTVTAKEGYRITAIVVDGTAQPTVYNMSTYTYIDNNVTKQTYVSLECAVEDTVYSQPAAGKAAVELNTEEAHSALSVAYKGENNEFTVLPESGYYLSGVTIQSAEDKKAVHVTFTDNSYQVTGIASGYTVTKLLGETASYQKGAVIVLPADCFAHEAELTVSSYPETFTATVTYDSEKGSVGCSTEGLTYGTKQDVEIKAYDNYYISYLSVNGARIPFSAAGWEDAQKNIAVGEYIGGTYRYSVAGNVAIQVGFERISYSVKVESSVNGTTSLSVIYNGNLSEEGKALAGGELTVLMEADEGYHIATVYINGVDMKYTSGYTDVNNDIQNNYHYNGTAGNGIMQDISVRVVYEINRYGFTYETVNDSMNFAGALGAGTLSCSYTKDGEQKYTGIAHGDNFSLNITPALSAGYYLYGITVKYKGYGESASEATPYVHTYTDGDGLIRQNGGVVWFNDLIAKTGIASNTGVTAEIELITVIFKRKLYSMTARQIGVGGSVDVTFSNTSAQEGAYIQLLGRVRDSDDEYTVYYYNPSTKKFLTYNGATYSETAIAYGYQSGKEGLLVFSDGAHEYEFMTEHGLFVSMTLLPDTGYNRTSFTVNGEEYSDRISNNIYKYEVRRDNEFTVTYEVQTFTIGVNFVVYNKSEKKVDASELRDYVTVTLAGMKERGGKATTYSPEVPNLSQVKRVMEYGTYYKFTFGIKFEEKGVYLYNFLYNEQQTDAYEGDEQGTVTFGENMVTEDVVLNVYFKIRQYSVSGGVKYSEKINNESANNVRGDASNVEKWTVYWGDSTSAKITTADGYETEKILVYADGTQVAELTPASPSSGSFNYVENDNSEVYGVRNALYLSSVRSDISIEVYLVRKSYRIMYKFNNEKLVERVETTLNEYNTTYPGAYYSSADSASPFNVETHYYDELKVVIYPIDGYELTATTVELKTIKVNELGTDWVETGDSQMLLLNKTGVGDAVYFTFHPTSSAATMQVTGNLRVELTITIKRYTLRTNVVRTDASADTSEGKNNTIFLLSAYDTVNPENGNPLTVLNAAQTTQTITKGTSASDFIIQHDGSFVYVFTTPDGYKLGSFSANGYTLDELTEKGMANYSVVKNSADGQITFTYTVTVAVGTDLVDGASGYVPANRTVAVSITVIPITYKIEIFINDAKWMFDSYNMRNGVSDRKTMIVYSSATVTHFAMLNIEPSLYEGYEIQTNKTKITIGNTNTDFNSGTVSGLTSRTQLKFNSANLSALDVTQEEFMTVRFYFTTRLIVHTFNLYGTVFYSQDVDGTKVLKSALLKDYEPNVDGPDAGKIKYSIEYDSTKLIDPVADNKSVSTMDTEYDRTKSEIKGDYPYFTTFTVQIVAESGFAMFAVYEVVGKTETKVTDGTQGVKLSSEISGSKTVYTLTFNCDSIGDRTFRVDFKQKTSVRVKVANPYKYTGTNTLDAYKYYTELDAYESDVATSSGSMIQKTNAVSGVVVGEYVYEVYVGNYFSVKYNDLYPGVSATEAKVAYYTADMKAQAQSLINDSDCYTAGVFDRDKYEAEYALLDQKYLNKQVAFGGDSSGIRYQICGGEVFYVYNTEEYARVTATKVTNAASTEVGGGVYYNESSAESTDNVIYQDITLRSTIAGHILTVACEANENYAFYRLRFKQVNETESAKKGYLVYEDTDLLMWEDLIYTDIQNGADSATVSNFNERRSSVYGCVLLNFRKYTNPKTGREQYLVTLWMNGDLQLVAEYYHTYSVSYGLYLADKVQIDATDIPMSGITPTDGEDVMFDRPFANKAAEATSVTISYDSSFSLQVATQSENYRFCGWYVNGVNRFPSLDKLMPDDNYLTCEFNVNYDDMTGLIDSDGKEVSDIQVYAWFEPVIDVQILNEKFYAQADHFNSWNMGNIQAVGYPFTKTGAGAPGTTATYMIGDTEGKTVTEALTYLKQSFVYQDYGSYVKWDELLNNATVAAYSSDVKNASKVYTDYTSFSVMFQNITNEDYVNNSWTNGSIELYMTGMGDARFSTWQYYNWLTEKWVNIGYMYEDLSYGTGSDGSAYVVGCTETSYIFALEYLYSGEMPNAINKSSGTEGEKNLNGTYPLLIRPDTYKSITVELQQFAFSKSYSKLGDVDQVRLGDDIVMPSILEYEADENTSLFDSERNYINDDGLSGVFEYGTTLYLHYNSADPGGEVFNATKNIRYRFVGWHTKIDGVNYLLEGSGDTSGTAFSYRLVCHPDQSNLDLILKSYYVAQYRQKFYSFGISGGTSDTYTACALLRSGAAAPNVVVTARTANAIYIESVAVNNGVIDFGNEKRDGNRTVTDYLQVVNPSGLEILSTKGASYTTDPALAYEFYMDAGLTYTVTVQKTADVSATADIKSNGSANNNFNHEFDTLYSLTEDGTVTQDFSKFYNTGNATYYAGAFDKKGKLSGQRAVSPEYMTKRALQSGIEGDSLEGWENGAKSYTSDTVHSLEIRYVSTSVLIFYNMIYYSGITVVNSNMLRALTGGQKSKLTVWDVDSTGQYGGWVTDPADEDNILPKTSANGEVVIRTTLVGMNGKGYADFVKYALYGMAEGNGFITLDYMYDSSKSGLFSPDKSGYGRWVEIDLNTKFGGSSAITSTKLFGDAQVTSYNINSDIIGIHALPTKEYTLEYCGNGTETYPYRVYTPYTDTTKYITDNTQLRNIDLFWKNNEYSCCYWTEGQNGSGETVREEYRATCFRLVSALVNLQGQDRNGGATGNPHGYTTDWDPLCGVITCDSDETIVGFDGYLDCNSGNGTSVVGLAVGTGTDPTTFTNINYYGMFSKIVGIQGVANSGRLTNLKFGNIFINVNNPVYVAGIVGYAENATFSNITITESGTQAYTNHTFISGYTGIQNTAGIYINNNCSDGVIGAFLAKGKNITLNGLTLQTNKYVTEMRSYGYAGALFGMVEGGDLRDISVSGNSLVVVNCNDFSLLGEASGGLFGYAGGDYRLSSDSKVTVNNELTVTNVSFGTSGSPTYLTVGTEDSNVSGGVFGIVGWAATVKNVRFYSQISTAFSLDVEEGIISLGTYLRAKESARSDMKMATQIGKYGFVGGIAGLNYGTLDNSELTGGIALAGLLHIYSGTAGGVVGANFGTVNGFRINSSQYYLHCWQCITGTEFYNFGGMVGYNFAGTANITVLDSVSGKIKTAALINECVAIGNTSNTSTCGSSYSDYTGSKAIENTFVYVFTRTGMDDVTYQSGEQFFTGKNEASGDDGYSNAKGYNHTYLVDNQNYLTMGGIVAYSSGRVYNSGIGYTRLSHAENRYAYNKGCTLGTFGWLVRAGLVCGYFDPPDKDIYGIGNYYGPDNPTLKDFDPRMDSGEEAFESVDGLTTKFNTSRIQSCFVESASININGALWLDNKWDADDVSAHSTLSGVYLGGICGGTSSNANNYYYLTNCEAVNVKIYAVFQAYGLQSQTSSRTTKDAGHHVYSSDSKNWIGKVTTTYYGYTIRPLCAMEIDVAQICGGRRVGITGQDPDQNIVGPCVYSGGSVEFTPPYNNENWQYNLGSSSTGWFGIGGGGDADGVPDAYRRFLRYTGLSGDGFDSSGAGSTVADTTDPIPAAVGNMEREVESTDWEFGFKKDTSATGILIRNVIKTDPESGFPLAYDNKEGYYCYYQEGVGNNNWHITDTAPTLNFSSYWVKKTL